VSKFEIMERIRRINTSAQCEFLAGFSEEELLAYLHQLQELQREQVGRQCREQCGEPALAAQA
jgi:hypothetical protein